jgi:hypothetical protein
VVWRLLPALGLLAGCFSEYVLPSAGFDQTAAMSPAGNAEIAVGGGVQLTTSASPGGSRQGEELTQGDAMGTFAISNAMAVLLSGGQGAGEAALKLHLPVAAFDLAVQPETGFAGLWSWQTNQTSLQGTGLWSAGMDLLASGPIAPGLTLYGGLRGLGAFGNVADGLAGAGVGLECRWGPLLLRPEIAVSQMLGAGGATQFIAYPHLTLAVRP